MLTQPKDRSVYPKNAHVRGLDHVTLRLWGIDVGKSDMTTNRSEEVRVSAKGRYELTASEFRSSVLGISPSSILVLDLDVIIPEFRSDAGEDAKPSYKDIWRSACDHVLMMNRGIYALQDDGCVHIYFYELPSALGTVKLDQITDMIRDGLKAAMDEPKSRKNTFGGWGRNTLSSFW